MVQALLSGNAARTGVTFGFAWDDHAIFRPERML